MLSLEERPIAILLWTIHFKKRDIQWGGFGAFVSWNFVELGQGILENQFFLFWKDARWPFQPQLAIPDEDVDVSPV